MTDGQNHWTHLISTWLSNNASFFDEAQDVAADDPSGQALREWTRELLYGSRDGWDADDRHTLEQVRDRVSRSDFETRVDWVAVRRDLLGF